MELTKKDYKFINNTGNLPGFVGGNVPTGYESSFIIDKLTGYPSSTNNYGNLVDTSILPKSGTANITKSINNYTSVPGNTDVRPEGKPLNTTNPNGNFTNGGGAASGAGPGFAIGGWLGGGALNGLDRAFNAYDSDTLLANAGTFQANVGGIGFTKQNAVNSSDAIRKYKNEYRMDWWTSPGSAIGALVGYGHAREQAKLAETKSINLANALTGSALTKSMRLNYSKEHGDSSTLSLYGAKDGKLPKYNNGKPGGKPVFSTDGINGVVNRKPNIRLCDGEELVNMMTGELVTVGNLNNKNNNDTLYGYIDPAKWNYTMIASNKGGASDLARMGDYEGAAAVMMNNPKTDYLFRAKCGKLPKFAEGGWGNAITSGIGMLTGIGQMISAAMNKPYRPNTYVENPYELNALNTLAGLQVNPYPIIQEMRKAESRTNRAIDRSGGLSTAQRGLSRLSALYGTLSNIANTLAGIQQLNNQYKANYANTALNVGANNARNRMAANQWDLDYFSKAHAARLGGMQTGMLNMLAQAQNWYRNDFKRRQFNDTMSLYKQEQQDTAAANEAMRKYNQLLIDMLKLQYMSDDYLRQLITQRGWRLANV